MKTFIDGPGTLKSTALFKAAGASRFDRQLACARLGTNDLNAKTPHGWAHNSLYALYVEVLSVEEEIKSETVKTRIISLLKKGGFISYDNGNYYSSSSKIPLDYKKSKVYTFDKTGKLCKSFSEIFFVFIVNEDEFIPEDIVQLYGLKHKVKVVPFIKDSGLLEAKLDYECFPMLLSEAAEAKIGTEYLWRDISPDDEEMKRIISEYKNIERKVKKKVESTKDKYHLLRRYFSTKFYDGRTSVRMLGVPCVTNVDGMIKGIFETEYQDPTLPPEVTSELHTSFEKRYKLYDLFQQVMVDDTTMFQNCSNVVDFYVDYEEALNAVIISDRLHKAGPNQTATIRSLENSNFKDIKINPHRMSLGEGRCFVDSIINLVTGNTGGQSGGVLKFGLSATVLDTFQAMNMNEVIGVYAPSRNINEDPLLYNLSDAHRSGAIFYQQGTRYPYSNFAMTSRDFRASNRSTMYLFHFYDEVLHGWITLGKTKWCYKRDTPGIKGETNIEEISEINLGVVDEPKPYPLDCGKGRIDGPYSKNLIVTPVQGYVIVDPFTNKKESYGKFYKYGEQSVDYKDLIVETGNYFDFNDM